MRRLVPLLCCTALLGCATAHLTQPRPPTPPGSGAARTVVIEPLFETAEWKTDTVTEQAMATTTPYGGGLSMGPQPVTISREVSMKPFFARVPVLAEIHKRLLAELKILRPSWNVVSTGDLLTTTGPITLIRTLISGNETVESDRTLKNLAFAFGLVIWPLMILAAQPVNEVEHVDGSISRFTTDAATFKGQLVRYPSQPDFAVNIVGLKPLVHEFGLDVAYSEGVLANEKPRQSVLIDGFVQRYAAAIVAIVEEP